jgi:hypothetical protein
MAPLPPLDTHELVLAETPPITESSTLRQAATLEASGKEMMTSSGIASGEALTDGASVEPFVESSGEATPASVVELEAAVSSPPQATTPRSMPIATTTETALRPPNRSIPTVNTSPNQPALRGYGASSIATTKEHHDR